MNEPQLNELHFEGRIQIDIAQNALAYTGVNPDAQALLLAYIHKHDRDNHSQLQKGFSVDFDGQQTEKYRNDIMSSLEFIATDETVPLGIRLASTALHDILQPHA